jgi:hypothetical protein
MTKSNVMIWTERLLAFLLGLLVLSISFPSMMPDSARSGPIPIYEKRSVATALYVLAIVLPVVMIFIAQRKWRWLRVTGWAVLGTLAFLSLY